MRASSDALEGRPPQMTWLEKHFAALAERMIDAELVWQVRRLPQEDEQTALQRAVKKEAERRFPEMDVRL